MQVKNHGIAEKVYDSMLEACENFISMADSEKQEFKGKKNDVMERIRFGTSNNLSLGKAGFWRDYLKFFVHPDFNSPHKPAGFRYTSIPSYSYLKYISMYARTSVVV